MDIIILEKWDEGFDKVGLTNLQRELLGLSLSEAKYNTDNFLDGEIVEIPVKEIHIAEEFVKRAKEIHVLSRYRSRQMS